MRELLQLKLVHTLAPALVKQLRHGAEPTAVGGAMMDDERRQAAIRRAQLVLEYGMDGRILSANDNFLALSGYTDLETISQAIALP